MTERALRPAFAARLPDDPAGALVERIEEVEGLASVATRSEREGAALRDAAATAEQTRTALAGSVEAEKARLPLAAAAALATRAAQLARPAQLPAVGAKPPSDGGGAGLAAFATELAAALARFAEAMARVADERAGSDATFVAEAAAAVDDLVPPQRELDALASSVEDTVRAAAGDIRAGEERASRLEDQLRRKAELVAKAASLASRADVYQALSHELQANAIVDFVQAEALTALAAEGTKRLQYLSDGRYRLRYREDEFFVVDRVNGDEERSVRTLSGGESFLASLALALTLSEQIRALATTERARLDSLFLDEGFGTLDPETLAAVIAGIARLGVDGRLVGVISHVRELTDQFPRIEVEKSQRGSRTKVVV
ncbi:MAG: hypothetical protein AUH85_17455 [Chloroflexi bacterium 13_1_40CM_4_68_4]|nr:MAG: hypothetical protein AUH85_17455 [Chloroflexi bacterium 13_1_40CM_4_68_4]